MNKAAYLSLVAILVAVTLVAPSSITVHPLQRRQGVNCTDPNAITSGLCWEELHLAEYLTDWHTNRPICSTIYGTLEDGANCCAPNEVWSTCFIRLAIGNHGYNCININEGTCPNFQVGASIAPQVRYILGTMYNINNFFSNWNGALPYATLSALLINQPLVLEIDPIQKTNLLFSDLLSALTAGLSFIAAPELSGLAGTAATALIKGLQAAPSVAKAIWPTGTADSQSEQLANLDSYLSQIDQNFTTRITQGLYTIMSDVPSFNGFASSGQFSGPNNLSLPADSDILALGLRTFILSSAMSANKWRAVTRSDLTMADVAGSVPGSGGSDCTFGSNNICTNSKDETTVFYSNSTARAYEVVLSGAGPDPTSFMNEIVNKEWSNLEQLFDGAYNCSFAPGGSGIGKPLSLFNGTAVDFACMSQLSISEGK
ncbi:hypothetical protein HO133_006583 [Letharia lupina]|uniref:Uncharacterized protein n=1 Tax=Letharia lupina TaxID=560253 RepID=A0A8H6C6V5_9LECA|nr:uncharacterized protein HO133_006583 [Letharia lupina]KAF6217756.1 hypothetical protein HO133_006583 [Letharia lupina]